ncbi:LuxR C-terminal-related transcriptional regulator [Flammeovirga kamogawensis]|uniref:PAS domain-containing protein n=1 Tax=Flammeovirga kamogawensis TaxID=373891 RepID=A0ABX8H2D0_9BACT|nr:LuxR C-terminal-related transcriptional regulator [Flammeovirga kamogawensis]MBB6460247.1 DNA-binding CsgD family transcriptional regulator [Flammeovirga kamogawensis]QWG10060.1 hypothetical protein KM029_20470 [Flammeovirga kamogawensis]TRX65567.1 hypothetical protein EO216_23900 [Flammeovirga kamogawensis]
MNTILQKHTEIAKQIEKIQSSCITIFDFTKREHVFVSDNFAPLLGWDIDQAFGKAENYIDKKVHPEDIAKLEKMSFFFINIFNEFDDKEEVKNYKYLTEYRIKNSQDKYVWVTEQHTVVELTDQNEMWLVLGILDLSPSNHQHKTCNALLTNIKTGDVTIFPEEKPSIILSKREIQVLEEISKGYVSKQIADRLNISINTVNTHRQKIIDKMEVNNTTEAVQRATEVNLFN